MTSSCTVASDGGAGVPAGTPVVAAKSTQSAGDPWEWNRSQKIRTAISAGVIILLIVGAYLLHQAPGKGAPAAVSLLLGAALGIAFERGRFCFFCIFRDFFERRATSGLYAILTALAVGTVGYTLIFGQFLPDPTGGKLAPTAHIGPLSWVTVVAGIAFGVGMAFSGACISGHLYRLGQGYTRAIPALLGTFIGFGLGFWSWNSLYFAGIDRAPTPWLPNWLGYGGALVLQLTLLGGLALLLLLRWPQKSESSQRQVQSLAQVRESILFERWRPGITGSIVGLIGVAAYLRVEPLGVTRQIGTWVRTELNDADLIPTQLHGLDLMRGCATVVSNAIVNNGWLLIGLVLASFAAAVIGGRFRPSKLTARGTVTAFGGGILLGWGAMVGLGCTVGVLLSGIQAFAVAGWVFGAAIFLGTWVGVRFRWHQLD